jgi:hypothetical protein
LRGSALAPFFALPRKEPGDCQRQSPGPYNPLRPTGFLRYINLIFQSDGNGCCPARPPPRSCGIYIFGVVFRV